MKQLPRSGFTLIELSIVLVIIGLIVGGVLIGRDMIKAAQVRKIFSEIESVQTAVNTFRIKYNCLPGDCPNASTFFSGATNGNGNTKISNFLTGNYTEVWQFWSQLAAAGLDNGSYTGAGAGRQCTPGVNVKASQAIGRAGYTVVNMDGYADTGNDYTPPISSYRTDNIMYFGLSDGGTMETYAPILTVMETFQLDAKFDDGLPASGRMIHEFPVYYTNCATSTTASAARYDVTQTAPRCIIRLYPGF